MINKNVLSEIDMPKEIKIKEIELKKEVPNSVKDRISIEKLVLKGVFQELKTKNYGKD